MNDTDTGAEYDTGPPRTPGLTPLVSAMDGLAAVFVLVMAVLVNIDVFGRWLFNAPMAGTLELTEMGIVAIVYLGLAYAIRTRRLTRSDALLGLLERRGRTGISQSLRLAFNAAGILVFAIIAWGQVPRLIDAWSRGYYKGNVGVFTAPTWPLETITLLGAAAAAAQFAVMAFRNIRMLGRARARA